MALPKDYDDLPGTVVFDADQARKGYHLNMCLMSLMKAENRAAFKKDERAYLDRWPMTEAQKQAMLPPISKFLGAFRSATQVRGRGGRRSGLTQTV